MWLIIVTVQFIHYNKYDKTLYFFTGYKFITVLYGIISITYNVVIVHNFLKKCLTSLYEQITLSDFICEFRKRCINGDRIRILRSHEHISIQCQKSPHFSNSYFVLSKIHFYRYSRPSVVNRYIILLGTFFTKPSVHSPNRRDAVFDVILDSA